MGWVSGAAVAVLAAAVVWLYNRLVRARVRVDEAWAQVNTELQRRHDLIPNAVATVAAYAGHERGTLDAVTQARAAALRATAPAERADAEAHLGEALGRLLALKESYPQLRADEGFRLLTKELSDTEARLAFARDFASHRTARYHERLETFPSVIVASLFGFQRAEMFAIADAAARRVPAVDLEVGS